ncbi:unnamed protein product, partial [Owenia fusiformis]
FSFSNMVHFIRTLKSSFAILLQNLKVGILNKCQLIVPYLVLFICFATITMIYQRRENIEKLVGKSTTHLFGEGDVVKEKKLPGLLIVGVQKCGTQAIATFLAHHPNLTRAGHCEIHFFDKITEKKPKSIQEYIDIMPETGPWEIAFEKTPAYFGGTDPVHIYNMLPDVKILIQMCNPIDRAMSSFLHSQHLNPKVKFANNASFESKVFDANGNINTTCIAIRRGVYVYDLLDYLNYFPRKNILILETEELKKNPAETLQKVEKFLNIPPFFKEEQFYMHPKLNTSCVHMEYLHTERFSAEECLGGNKHRKHPDMNPDTRQKLQKYFTPLNKKLSIVARMNFSWI